jgi:hypothetical protein
MRQIEYNPPHRSIGAADTMPQENARMDDDGVFEAISQSFRRSRMVGRSAESPQ